MCDQNKYSMKDERRNDVLEKIKHPRKALLWFLVIAPAIVLACSYMG